MGASPWSTSTNPYAAMIEVGKNAEEIRNLFNNAKKIYLGMQIQYTINKRRAFWEKFKVKIVENCRLDYENAFL